jgi:hypothetical protein
MRCAGFIIDELASVIASGRMAVRFHVCSSVAPSVLVATSLCVAGCLANPSDSRSTVTNARIGPTEYFQDVAADAGLSFVHRNGMTGQYYYAEIMAPGVALFDSDNDGDLDVLLLQGGDFDASPPSKRPSNGRVTTRLFRNDLHIDANGHRTLHFTDATEGSGISMRDYAMGIATGDYDNDGCVDVYVTALGRNRLFQNDCAGVFKDVSMQSGVSDTGWSVSAGFFDFDRDGWLDLYVGHYLNWDKALNTPCYGSSGQRVYCAPEVYRAQQSRLYRNNRDGTFADVTVQAGVAAQFGPALGVSSADFNGDGWIDFYVANDGEENQLWINQRDGTFENRGLLSGTALGPSGKAKAGMGVDAGDFDDDGDEDLFVTNLTGEGHDLYVNDGSGTFVHRSPAAGLAHTSLAFTGFGAAWLDADNDGRLDLLTVNGAVQMQTPAHADDDFPLGQRKQLFRNQGNGRFEDVTGIGGSALSEAEVSRGAAFGDVDNDGDVDVVVGNNHGSVRLLLNQVGQRQHWVGLKLVGSAGSDRLGARVAVTTGETTRWRRARTDGSYASANDPRVLVGLDDSTAPPRARVIWPSGLVEEWPRVELDRYTTLTEGSSQRP